MTADLSAFLKQHPALEVFDLLIPDINGILRGKKINANNAQKSFAEGVLLPRSLYALDVNGGTVEETRLGITTGDQDYTCKPEAGTLRVVPWTSVDSAQCMMEMYDENDLPFPGSPRQVLRNVVAALHDNGLFPTVAVELEFYLFRETLDKAGQPQLLIDPISGEASRSTQVYSIDDLDHYRPFIEAVQRYCKEQNVPASAAVAEYAPGQFEINLAHKGDPVEACDDALYLKRIIKLAARENSMTASFMAKPLVDQTGSGMHIHVSICDADGTNRFARDEEELRFAIGGLQASMAENMLLFAPHANSFRRFRPHAYVPLSPTWGYNNRSVALRVPAGPENSRRIEHRLAGADANPYLVMAGVLAGILHGYRHKSPPDDPIEGDAAELRGTTLPCDWLAAINKLAGSELAAGYFGSEFVDLYTTVKRGEYLDFGREVPPLDIQWYFQTV